MTTFNATEAFVWIWLPTATQPIVAGKLEVNGDYHDFFYGQSYLNHAKAIALSPIELPLIKGQRVTSRDDIHAVFRDALPDAWGRRVLNHSYRTLTLTPLDMLLLSSSDRIGALHFQTDPTTFMPKEEKSATLPQLYRAVELIDAGEPLPRTLQHALLHGTSIGGARPKALLDADNKKIIAKFATSTDYFPVVQAEFAAMWLANKVGLQTATVKLEKINRKFVLLIDRFDRVFKKNGWQRKFLVSALTLLNLNETMGRYASYLELADHMRRYCRHPSRDLMELFRRMVFNILIGNTDDHAKNHAFFWDGDYFELTPAYDICPYLRVGQQATQAMIVGEQGAFSLLSNALSAASRFQLSKQTAQTEIDTLVDAVRRYWPIACERAQLTALQQQQLTGTAVLNPYCFYTEV